MLRNFLILIIILGFGAGFYWYWFLFGPQNLAKQRPPLCAELKDRNGVVFDYACATEQRRLWRSLPAIDPNLTAIVVMMEDDKFFEHSGLDLSEIWNAIEKDIEKKKIVRGGSTITQQLAKNLFLSKEKTLARKASEVPLALRLEKELTKKQILELYLNTIEWGPGIYGAEMASRLYFDHDSYSMKTEEAWLLALMIPNPKELNLWINPNAQASLLKRAQSLATRLVQGHKLTNEQATEAFKNFEAFLEVWKNSQYNQRQFPQIWAKTKTFPYMAIPSVQKELQKQVAKNPEASFQTHIDANLQSRLLSMPSDIPTRPEQIQKLLVLLDGKQVRAVTVDDPKLPQDQLFEMAHEYHVDIQHITPKAFASFDFIR